MIKLIMCDMDGTLMTDDNRMPPDFPEMLAELKNRGARFVPASGRQYYSLLSSFSDYKDDMIFLAENGCLIKDGHGKEYFSNVMDRELLHKAWDKCLSLNDGHMYPVCCGKKACYIMPHWEPYLEECKKYFDRYKYVESFDEIDDDVVKLAMADNENWQAEKNLYHSFDEFTLQFQVSLSSDLWVDLTNNGANKGAGIAQLCKQLGVKFEECAAFGDFLNDYEMMGAVYYSYAMANAHPKLKEAARFQAASNNEYGVTKKIFELMEQGLI